MLARISKDDVIVIDNTFILGEEAYDYAQLINNYPLEHEDYIQVLKVVAEVGLKTRKSGEQISSEIKNIYSNIFNKEGV